MTTRAGFILVGIVSAAILWIAGSLTGDVIPTTDELIVPDSQPSVGRAIADEPARETPEVTEALADAEAEIERLRAELAAAEAADGEEDEDEGILVPRGYSGAARVLVSDARSVFEAELVDSSWAPAAESELYTNLVNRVSSDGLQINIVDVRCKTDACRVEMSYPGQASNESELAEITQPGAELSRKVFGETDSVSSSGLLQTRGMFPGELTTSELYLFRTGADGIVHTVETPKGVTILDLAGQKPGSRSGL